MKLTALRSDSKKETEGVWAEWEHGISLLIARLNNPGFQAAIRKLTLPHTKAIREKKFSDMAMEDLTAVAMSEHILLGWKGIEEENGKPLKYTPKKALNILRDPGLRDLYQFVLQQANERERYRLVAEEETRKN